jgi:hypothetical protein
MFNRIFRAVRIVLYLLTTPYLPVAHAQDGPPGEFGPSDPHNLSPTGLNQKVLVIYVQADDFRILPSNLSTLNTFADQNRNKVSPWFNETSWNALTVDMQGQRAAGGQWYVLPDSMLNYVRPGGVPPMQVRNAASASTTNPTPPASVTASAAANAASTFVAGDAGNYFYAVSAFRNGVESQLTKISTAVAVAAGDQVTLAITSAVSDADRYLVYRTPVGATSADANFSRIGQVNAAGGSTPFTDTGIKMDALGDWEHIIVDAMTAAHADVPDFDPFKGVLVVFFAPFLRGQAGGKTFTIAGSPINIAAVYLSSQQDFGRYTHEMGHWIGLPDLYDPVTAGSIATWDTMDCACDGEYQTWEKDFLLHYLANPANVVELFRPAPGSPDRDQDFIIHPTELADIFSNQVTAVKIKSSDTVHYYIEGRRHITGDTSDQNTPAQHVVIDEGIDVLPMGIIPKRNVKLLTVLNAGDPAFSPEPGGNVEITFSSINAGADESYNVHVKLKALPQPDPAITPWAAPPWESPDIWIDSSREGGGFQDPATATPLAGNGEHAWVGHENRVWAKITNKGDGAATNIHVKFKVNTPGGIGDSGQFIDLPDPPPFDLAPHEVKMIFTTWTPTVAGHTCIKVEIDHVPGEADINNNFAQENVDDFYTGSSSPWHQVLIPLDVANPLPETRRVDIEIAGLPQGWKGKIEKRWVTLGPKGRIFVNATIIPKPDAPECTTAVLNIYGLIRIDDFIQPYSGFTPIIHLANPIQFKVSVDQTEVGRENFGNTYRVHGCTFPAQPNSEIAIEYEDPFGQTHVTFAQTDANGCFDKVISFPTNGNWTVRTYFPGSTCKAPTESEPIPVSVNGTGQGRGPTKRGAIYFGALTGGNWPAGNMRKFFDPGFMFAVQTEYQTTPALRLGLQLGYHQFAAEPAASADNLGVTNLSGFARFTIPTPNYRVFLMAGPGAYRVSGSWKPGAQFGGGLEVQPASGIFLSVGTAFHVAGAPAQDIGKLKWFDAYIGVSFRVH